MRGLKIEHFNTKINLFVLWGDYFFPGEHGTKESCRSDLL